VDGGRAAALNRWLPTTPNQIYSPFTLEVDTLAVSRRPLGIPFSCSLIPSPSLFAVTPDGKSILSCGHWDNSFKSTLIEQSKPIQSIVRHKDVVTCMALGTDGKTLITGSRDTTLMVWEIGYGKTSEYEVNEVPLHILYGHDDEVTCVAINIELDVALSGSTDGSCVVHTVRRGKYVRSIFHPKRHSIHFVATAPDGKIVTYSHEDMTLFLYSINGKLLKTLEFTERMNHAVITRDAEFIICGGEKGVVTVRKLHSLEVLHKFSTGGSICSVAISAEDRHIFVGLRDGKLVIIAEDSL